MALLALALGLGACKATGPVLACMSIGSASPAVVDAAAFRIEVYDSGVGCSGTTVSVSSVPLASHLYTRGQPIVLKVAAGQYTLVLTTYADATARLMLGQGCVVADVAPGAQICVALTVVPTSDLGVFASDLMSSSSDLGPPNMIPCDRSWLVCDDFEGAALDSSWSLYQASGSAALDSTRAYTGAQSLRAHADSATGGGHGTIFRNLQFPLPDTFARMFLFVPATPSATTYLSTVGQQGAPYDSTQLILENSAIGTHNSGDGTMRTSTVMAPVGRWFCLEWQMHFDASGGYSNIWLDGRPVMLPSGTEDTAPSPFYYYFRIGVETSANMPAMDLWIDDVAVAPARIGCGS